MPPGIPYIIGNEAAERFSYYGMRGILTIFMTRYLLDQNGQAAPMGENEAKYWFHIFATAVYFIPFLGGLVADIFLGKYRTILALSVVYCLGHLALALDDTRLGLAFGLALISIGSGGIKPCVSAHVGDQFGRASSHLLSRVFGWFYFAINLGAFASSLLTPWLLRHHGPHVAFGVPGLLMFLATLIFWLGRHKFVHIPRGGWKFFREVSSGEGLRALLKLSVIFIFIAPFWALFDQTGSAWVLQAERMDRVLFGTELLSSQIQAANPALIMLLIPVFSYIIYPAIQKIIPLTPLRRIAIGLFLTVTPFLLCAWIERQLTLGLKPTILWQLLAYLLLTAAEVMVSITALEFAYTQAPRTMKSLILSLYLLSISLGNLFTALVNFFIRRDDGSSMLAGVEYYLFFSAVMLGSSIFFVVVAYFYRERTYIQGEPSHFEDPR